MCDAFRSGITACDFGPGILVGDISPVRIVKDYEEFDVEIEIQPDAPTTLRIVTVSDKTGTSDPKIYRLEFTVLR
jgi:hypothetical protein